MNVSVMTYPKMKVIHALTGMTISWLLAENVIMVSLIYRCSMKKTWWVINMIHETNGIMPLN